MFSLFNKNPLKALTKQYEKKLEQAMHAQRSGDMHSYSIITEEAEKIRAEIETIERLHNTP